MSEYFDGDALKASRYWRRFLKLTQYEDKRGRKLNLKGDTVLVEKLPTLELKTKSGLIIAETTTHRETAADAATDFGLVLRTGPGQYFEDGTIQPCEAKPGDVILLPGNVRWFSQFGHIVGMKPYTIGLLRDAQILMDFKDYMEVFNVLNEYDSSSDEFGGEV